MSDDLIKRSDAIKALDNAWINGTSLLDANEAVKQLNDLPSADRPQEWIPCSERLPETLGEYLITALSNPHKNRIVSAGYYNNRFKEFGTYRADASWEKWAVIAWMPLPNPWKGASDERWKL